MIKNLALKTKNRLFNLTVLLALYLEYFFFKWSYIKWCTNISAIISNAKGSRLHPLNLVTIVTAIETVYTYLSLETFSKLLLTSEARVCYQGSTFCTCGRQRGTGTCFLSSSQFHCVCITQPAVHILSIIIGQMDNGQIRGWAFRRHTVMLVLG